MLPETVPADNARVCIAVKKKQNSLILMRITDILCLNRGRISNKNYVRWALANIDNIKVY